VFLNIHHRSIFFNYTVNLTDTLQHLLYIWKENCLCQFDMHRILFTYVKSVQSCRHAQEAVLGLRCITSHVDAHCRTGIFCRTGTLCHKSDNCGTLRRTRFGLYPLSYIDAASTTIKKAENVADCHKSQKKRSGVFINAATSQHGIRS
jgi:hypothetical protein